MIQPHHHLKKKGVAEKGVWHLSVLMVGVIVSDDSYTDADSVTVILLHLRFYRAMAQAKAYSHTTLADNLQFSPSPGHRLLPWRVGTSVS